VRDRGISRWRSAPGIPSSGMRRALLIAVLALLVADASGFSSLLVPETCAIGVNESSPDTGCPAFCVRCTCSCCATAVVHNALVVLAEAQPTPIVVAVPTLDPLPNGTSPDILHVPKPLLT